MPDVADTLSDLPTSESPEEGVLTFYDVEVFPALHWVEDGDHVFRSTEFDLLAADRDQYVAIQKFIEMAEDLADYHVDLMKAGRATDEEADIALQILSRINELLERQLRLAKEQLQAQRRRVINVRRRRAGVRQAHAGRFVRSRPRSSSARLVV